MADLRTEPFVLFAGSSSAVNDAVLRSCRDAGFVPHREHEAAGISVLLPLVAADLGVALVPASVRAAPLAGVVFRDVTDAATVELALVWRSDDDQRGRRSRWSRRSPAASTDDTPSPPRHQHRR